MEDMKGMSLLMALSLAGACDLVLDAIGVMKKSVLI